MADAEGAPGLARARAAGQLLGDSKRRTPDSVVRHLLAVQAQDFASVPLALRARSRGLKRADLHAALDSGELVIGWLNRGTLHLVCRDDYAWLHALTAPTFRTANNRRLAQEGVTDPERGVRAVAKALGGGPLLRKEIGERVGFKGQALTHALVAASIDGTIVRGPVRGREQTFVLTGDHLGPLPKVDREAALQELGRRYYASHWPATERDLAYWSGLPLRVVPRPESLESSPDRPEPRRRATRAIPPKLLPPFDPYILGWRDRSFAIPEALAKRVMPGGGMFRAVVLIDGVVAATWSRANGRVTVDSDQPINGLEAEIADVERLLTAL